MPFIQKRNLSTLKAVLVQSQENKLLLDHFYFIGSNLKNVNNIYASDIKEINTVKMPLEYMRSLSHWPTSSIPIANCKDKVKFIFSPYIIANNNTIFNIAATALSFMHLVAFYFISCTAGAKNQSGDSGTSTSESNKSNSYQKPFLFLSY